LRRSRLSFVELARQPDQHDPRTVEVVPGGGVERSANSILDGSRSFAIERVSSSRQTQKRSAPIALVGSPPDQPAALELFQQGRERTGVHVEKASELLRVNTGKPTDDAEHQALRSRDAEHPGH
jgi:hypothetical protein